MCKRALIWLSEEIHGKDLLSFVFWGIMYYYAWSIVVTVSIKGAGASRPIGGKPSDINILSWEFPIVFLITMCIEEALFRLPLAIAVRYLKDTIWLLLVVLVLSMTFGIAHGNPECILIQGAAGVFLSTVFLKSGGYQGKTKRAYVTCVLAHSGLNVILFTVGLIAGKTTI